jgi:acyl-CoA reductase-like NAD-dependent aldehyde dehydrogenase
VYCPEEILGFKESGSGMGREMSRHVMDLYTEVKNIMVYLGRGV